MHVGKIEGTSPKPNISPSTKRFTNMIDDIEKTKPTDYGTAPPRKKLELQTSMYDPNPKNQQWLKIIPTRVNLPVSL